MDLPERSPALGGWGRPGSCSQAGTDGLEGNWVAERCIRRLSSGVQGSILRMLFTSRREGPSLWSLDR